MFAITGWQNPIVEDATYLGCRIHRNCVVTDPALSPYWLAFIAPEVVMQVRRRKVSNGLP